MIGMSDRCAVLWFRRDLRLADHPALLAAERGETVLALYVLDERLIGLAAAERGEYPLPIVDHAAERQEALRRYGEYVTAR